MLLGLFHWSRGRRYPCEKRASRKSGGSGNPSEALKNLPASPSLQDTVDTEGRNPGSTTPRGLNIRAEAITSCGECHRHSGPFAPKGLDTIAQGCVRFLHATLGYFPFREDRPVAPTQGSALRAQPWAMVSSPFGAKAVEGSASALQSPGCAGTDGLLRARSQALFECLCPFGDVKTPSAFGFSGSPSVPRVGNSRGSAGGCYYSQ